MKEPYETVFLNILNNYYEQLNNIKNNNLIKFEKCHYLNECIE